MILGASVNINSTYLVLGALAYAVALGVPIFKWVRSKLKAPQEDRRWNERVDRALWGGQKSRYEPNPPKGVVEQQEATATAVTKLVETVDRLVERFEQHVDHPPGRP